MTVATKSRYHCWGTSCLRSLHQEIEGYGVREMLHSEKAGLGPRHEAGVYPFSRLSLPKCMYMQSGDVERLDLEIRNLAWIQKAFQFVSRRGLCFEYLITSVLFLRKLWVSQTTQQMWPWHATGGLGGHYSLALRTLCWCTDCPLPVEIFYEFFYEFHFPQLPQN